MRDGEYLTWDQLTGEDDNASESSLLIDIIQTQQEKTKVLKNHKLAVVMISGDWCMPCKVITPQFAEFAKKYNVPGKVCLIKENVDSKLTPNCHAIPQFCFYFNGNPEPVKVITGADMNAVDAAIRNSFEFLSSSDG